MGWRQAVTSVSVSRIISSRRWECFQLLFTQMNLCVREAVRASLFAEAGERNSISNEAILDTVNVFPLTVSLQLRLLLIGRHFHSFYGL